jgi:hypothetical protein
LFFLVVGDKVNLHYKLNTGAVSASPTTCSCRISSDTHTARRASSAGLAHFAGAALEPSEEYEHEELRTPGAVGDVGIVAVCAHSQTKV